MPAANALDRSPQADPAALPLGRVPKGFHGVVVRIGGGVTKPHQADLERRLLEIGFVEGARIQLLHEGLFGRDPIAVRIHDTVIALRRAEADHILVTPVHPAGSHA